MDAFPSYTLTDNPVPVFSPPSTTQLPNTASTSASGPGGDSSLYLSTPPLSDATSSPPLTSSHPSSVSDRSPRPRPDSVQFGPRVARKSIRVSSSVFLEQQRGVQVASAEEFGVSNTPYPVISFSEPVQSILEDPQPLLDAPASPTLSLPNPYTTTLRRSQTTSSVATSTPTSSTAEFGPRPRPKLSLTLTLPDSKPAVSVTTIAINDADALLPNPYQPQPNSQSYFSPHTPAAPLSNPPIHTAATSSLGADLHSAVGVSYFSPHTPATTALLSSLGTGSTTATAIGTGPLGARRERQGEKAPGDRVSGLLAPPPTAAFGSYWSPHTPDDPENLESAIEGVHSRTATTDATHGHSAPTSHHSSSPHSSNEVVAGADGTASDSSSSTGNKGLVPNKNSSKPQLTLQTWDLEKMREEKKRQESTAARRQGSRDKDARNRERKERERTGQKEPQMTGQATETTKGETAPLRLKPRNGPVERPIRPPQQIVESNNTIGGRGRPGQVPHPTALRPGSQFFQVMPSPAQPTLQSQSAINTLQAPATQGNSISADLTQNRYSTALDIAWDAPPQLPLPLYNPYASLNANTNPGRDWSAHGRTPSEPNVPSVSRPGGSTQAGDNSTAKERKRFGFFRNAGATASETNLAGLAAPSAPAPGLRNSKDGKDINELKENRKSAFYSRGINASFEALVGWRGKAFSHSSTAVNPHGDDQPGKKGEKDEKLSYPTTAPLPAAAHPQPYSHSQAAQFVTLPRTDAQHQYTPPLHTPSSNPQVYPAPSFPTGERGPSFEDFGVEIGRVGRHKTHTPPAVADSPQVKKGHTKNSSSGVIGFRKMFGFGKKDKDKDKQKWI